MNFHRQSSNKIIIISSTLLVVTLNIPENKARQHINTLRKLFISLYQQLLIDSNRLKHISDESMSANISNVLNG